MIEMENGFSVEEALHKATEWAKEAGRIQMSFFRGNDLGITTKSNVYDVVTRVDKECEAYLLKQIAAVYPGHAVLGEESGKHEGKSDFCWVIDPLDCNIKMKHSSGWFMRPILMNSIPLVGAKGLI